MTEKNFINFDQFVNMMSVLYDEKLSKEWIAWVEQNNSKNTREKEIFPFIQSWIHHAEFKSLLDIGCGQGSCSSIIPQDIIYVGLDSSPTLIDRAKERYPESHKTFLLGDLFALPFEDSSFDALLSVWVWSHLEHLSLAAKEMFCVLKSSGKCLIITAHPKTYEERKTFYSEYAITRKLLTGTFNLGNNQFLSNTTLYLHTQNEIEEAIENAGFRIDRRLGLGPAKTHGKFLYLVIEASKHS